MVGSEALTSAIRDEALRVGFDLAGFAVAEPFDRERDLILGSLDRGHLAGMPWFTSERVRVSCNPSELLPGSRTIVGLGTSYAQAEPARPGGLGVSGRVARYAWGRDYHEVIPPRLDRLKEAIIQLAGPSTRCRSFVDTGQMVDRVAAERAGLGFVGKSTCLLTGPLGSYVFLSVILTTAALDPDPLVTRDCGSCRACLDACPTGAFVGPGQLDATRCISYLTVEHRGAIADDLRPRMGDWVFGCDVCQEVCPWNRARPAARHAELGSRAGVGASLDLIELARMDHATYLSRFRGTALKRAHHAGLRRNAVIAMGNVADPETVPALLEILRDPDPVLRHHSAWALGRQASLSGETRRAMRDAASFEHDPWVYDEILAALARHGDGRAPYARLDETSG